MCGQCDERKGEYTVTQEYGADVLIVSNHWNLGSALPSHCTPDIAHNTAAGNAKPRFARFSLCVPNLVRVGDGGKREIWGGATVMNENMNRR